MNGLASLVWSIANEIPETPIEFPVPSWKEFTDVVFKTHESGGGTYLLLWLFLLVLLIFNVVQFRIHRANTKREIAKLEADVKEYEERFGDVTEAFDAFKIRYARLQKKLSITTGMVIANLGNRKLPDGFWQAMMDDERDDIPSMPDKESVTIPGGTKHES